MISEGRGPIEYHAARYLIGISILFGLWYLLDNFVNGDTLFGLLMVYSRSILAGLWVIAGAPLLFKRIGLLP